MSKKLLFLFSFFLVILSCQKDEEPSITINGTEIAVAGTGGRQSISFESNMDWTAKSSESWCKLSPAYGNASIKSITAILDPNDIYDDRSTTVTIMSGGVSKSVTIKQSAKSGILVSSDKFNLTNEAATIEVEIQTNVEYDITISDDWITRNKTRALSSSNLYFNISKNESYDDRVGSISIKQKGGGLSRTIEVYQSQEDAIILSNKTVNISSEGQTLKVQLNTNVDFEVIIPENGSWVSYTATRALTAQTFLLNITKNNVSEARTTEVYVKDRATTLQDTLTIIQDKGLDLPLIEGSTHAIQHIDAPKDFILRLNDLKDKEVYFLFSNNNTQRPTTLPKVNSNVATMETVNTATAYSEQSFMVSGKPSVTHFNNNHKMYPKDGMPEPLYQKHLAAQPQKLQVGSSEMLYDASDQGHLSTVRKVISAHGKNLHVWVANDCWGPSSTKKSHVTQQMVDALGPKFLNLGADNDIYEWVTNAAGEPWGKTIYSNIIPETDDIHIWLTDIDGDNNDGTGGSSVVLGYFYARDNFKKSQYAKSNEKLMFTIDAVLLGNKTNGKWDVSHYWPMEVISALAHEFTHMIFFYQKEILKQQTSTTAINEMCAQCMEDLVANKILANGPRGVPYATPHSGSVNNPYGRLPLYNSHNDYDILDWSRNKDEVLINYSKTYALGAYMMRNYGGASLIRELVQNDASGSKSIVDAVNANGGNVNDYADVLQRFAAATLLSDNTAIDAGYSYNTGGWSTSTINGINYELGSINLYNYSPPPSVYNQLPTKQKPGSNIFYRAGSFLNGTKEWYFEGMSPDTRLTVVIK